MKLEYLGKNTEVEEFIRNERKWVITAWGWHLETERDEIKELEKGRCLIYSKK